MSHTALQVWKTHLPEKKLTKTGIHQIFVMQKFRMAIFPNSEKTVRRKIRTAKPPYSEVSVHRKIRTAKTPYGEKSYGKKSYIEKAYGENS